jgi:hypothetical protein
MRPEYEAPSISLRRGRDVLLENYKGKVRDIKILNADDIKADLRAIGLVGSPTQVGPTIEVRKTIIKRILGRSIRILKDVEKIKIGDKEFGPYKKDEIITDPDKDLVKELVEKGFAKIYDYDDLADEIINILSRRERG